MLHKSQLSESQPASLMGVGGSRACNFGSISDQAFQSETNSAWEYPWADSLTSKVSWRARVEGVADHAMQGRGLETLVRIPRGATPADDEDNAADEQNIGGDDSGGGGAVKPLEVGGRYCSGGRLIITTTSSSHAGVRGDYQFSNSEAAKRLAADVCLRSERHVLRRPSVHELR